MSRADDLKFRQTSTAISINKIHNLLRKMKHEVIVDGNTPIWLHPNSIRWKIVEAGSVQIA